MNHYKQYIIPIILVIAILATATGYFLGKEKYDSFGKLDQFNKDVTQSEYKVLEAPAEYFGSLAKLSNSDLSKQETVGLQSSRSYLPPGSSLPDDSVSNKQSATASGVEPSILPVEEYIYYDFKYTGEDFSDLLKDAQPVYKRDKLIFNDRSITSLLSSYSFGLINLSRLNRIKLQNFSVIEDVNDSEQAMSAYVDAIDQSISLYQSGGYETYSHSDGQEEQVQGPQISPSANSEIIQIATEFLLKYNVSLSGYGQPQIDQSAYGDIRFSDPNGIRYYPPTIDVIYPYLIDGQESLEEGSGLAGLRVSYNTYTKQVFSVHDLRIRQYQRSVYPGEMRSNQIVSLAERGGFRNYQYIEPKAKKITLELGSPEIKVMRMWRYTNQTSEEIFVPTLVFPILNRGDYWRTSVMVPLVKEILENEDYQPPVYPLDQVNLEGIKALGE